MVCHRSGRPDLANLSPFTVPLLRQVRVGLGGCGADKFSNGSFKPRCLRRIDVIGFDQQSACEDGERPVQLGLTKSACDRVGDHLLDVVG